MDAQDYLGQPVGVSMIMTVMAPTTAPPAANHQGGWLNNHGRGGVIAGIIPITVTRRIIDATSETSRRESKERHPEEHGQGLMCGFVHHAEIPTPRNAAYF